MFINCIVIELTAGDYNSYFGSQIHSIMVYLLIISSNLIIYCITRYTKQYFDNVNAKLNENKANIHETNQSYDCLQCRAIDLILTRHMCVFCSISFIQSKINQLLFKEMTLSHHFMQSILVLAVCSSIVFYYHNQTMHVTSYVYILRVHMNVSLLIIVCCL